MLIISIVLILITPLLSISKKIVVNIQHFHCINHMYISLQL